VYKKDPDTKLQPKKNILYVTLPTKSFSVNYTKQNSQINND